MSILNRSSSKEVSSVLRYWPTDYEVTSDSCSLLELVSMVAATVKNERHSSASTVHGKVVVDCEVEGDVVAEVEGLVLGEVVPVVGTVVDMEVEGEVDGLVLGLVEGLVDGLVVAVVVGITPISSEQ